MKVNIEEIRVGGDYREQPMLLLRHYAETHQMLLDALKEGRQIQRNLMGEEGEIQERIDEWLETSRQAIEAASFVLVGEN